MQHSFVLCPAADKAKPIFYMLNESFHIHFDFISIIPVLCTSNGFGIGTVVTLLFNVYHTATFERGTGSCALAFMVSFLGGGIIDPFGHGAGELYRVNPAFVFAVPSGFIGRMRS